MNLLSECSVCLKVLTRTFPIKHGTGKILSQPIGLWCLFGLLFFMTMASISSNDYSDSGALPSSSTSGSSDHPSMTQ